MKKCSKCNKTFCNNKALSQHSAAVHRGGGPLPGTNPRRTRRYGQGGGGGLRGVSINPSRTPVVSGEVVSLKGEDRIALVTLKRSQTFIKRFEVSPGMSLRLTHLARAYQRIQWLEVSFTVTPQVSVTINGGYVCGFIMDPTDHTITARQLSASQGAQTKKWYESTTVRMPVKRELLYTSSGEEPRLFIPAAFWIVTEGEPSTDLSIVVTARWKVRLTEPTVEESTDLSFVISKTLWAKAGNYNLQAGDQDGNNKVDDVRDLVPEAIRNTKDSVFYRVPTFSFEYSEGTGDTGSIQCHFIIYSAKDQRFYASQNGKDIQTTAWQKDVDVQVLVPCGTFMKYEGTGNVCGGGSLSVPPLSRSRGLTPSYVELSSFARCLRILTEQFNAISRTQMEDWEMLSEPSEERPIPEDI